MDYTKIFYFITEFSYLLFAIIGSFFWAILVGRQSLINIISGIYLSTLLFISFPYFNILFTGLEKPQIVAGVKIIIFVVMAVLSTLIFKKLMPGEYAENKFEALGKKFLLSIAFTTLFTSVSLILLPVTNFIEPNTFLLETFANKELLFMWLVAPLPILLFSR